MQSENATTGKRGAARNNSGESVDHSDPGLRVGPTTLSTSDRTSEACPPNSVNTGVGFDVGVNSSQSKSGRESESGALSGTSNASDILRSAATQRGSFLDEIQNNRNISVPESFRGNGRNRYCGAWTVYGLDGTRLRFHRVNCKTWG